MTSLSLSDSPGTFKADCNVSGTILENRPKFKFLQRSADIFFFFHHSSINTEIFKVENGLQRLVHHSFELGSRTGQVFL